MDRISSGPSEAGQRFSVSRKAPRYPICAEAEAVEPLSKQHISGTVSVISLYGCYFRTVEQFNVRAVLQLRITHDGATFESWARVANSIGGDGMGLAFFSTSPAQAELLQQWIDKIARNDALPHDREGLDRARRLEEGL